MYPRKVFFKDWSHPRTFSPPFSINVDHLSVRHCAFSAVPITMLLFAFIIVGETRRGGPLVLFVRILQTNPVFI